MIDSDSGRRRLVAENGKSFSSPHLSLDSERLVLIGWSDRTGQRELLSCTTSAWECDVFLRTDNRVISPVELDKETLIYSMSPGRIGGDNRLRYAYHDFYLQKKGSEPLRLTHFEFYQLDSINVAGAKVVFQAVGPREAGVTPPRGDLLAPASEIYALDFNVAEQRIRAPNQALKPLFLMNGLSLKPAVSRDGTRAAFWHTELDKGRYRYNRAVATISGDLLKYIDLEGISFSPGVFVDSTLLFNELFADHYKVKRFDLTRGSIEDIDIIEHAPAQLKALERINLSRRNGPA